MKISPLDIQHQKFRIIFRGYDSRDVDSFMELIYNEFEDLIKEKDDLKTELKDKTNLTDELLEREKTIKETMMTAQQVTQDMKSNAKKEADLIKSEAEIQGENIINNAHKRLAALLDDITEVKRQKAQFIASLRGLVDTHGKMLEVDEREDEGLRDIEERLKFLKRGR
ncbi:MAG: DivIVA domain-containing protein [Proteobacteria bacterium]|nr:DivIVA domain-containing protein [Pseudomonadota bacterium]